MMYTVRLYSGFCYSFDNFQLLLEFISEVASSICYIKSINVYTGEVYTQSYAEFMEKY